MREFNLVFQVTYIEVIDSIRSPADSSEVRPRWARPRLVVVDRSLGRRAGRRRIGAIRANGCPIASLCAAPAQARTRRFSTRFDDAITGRVPLGPGRIAAALRMVARCRPSRWGTRNVRPVARAFPDLNERAREVRPHQPRMAGPAGARP